MKKIIIYSLILFCSGSLYSQDFFDDVNEAVIRTENRERWIVPEAYRSLSLDLDKLASYLEKAPNRETSETLVLSVPMPDNTVETFGIQLSPIMEEGLGVQLPTIQTYFGKGISNPAATIYLDLTPKGFHGMILRGTGGAVFIDPYYNNNTQYYISYYKKDFDATANHEAWVCELNTTKSDTGNLRSDSELPSPTNGSRSSAVVTLKTYQLAVAATGEYTAYHGGTVNSGLAAIVTAINRVSGIYETELGIRFELVANNNQLVYTNASTDPYTNGDAGLLLGENQTNLDNIIGSANYDIGHVFSTGGGGLAGLGVICSSSRKAQGETGLTNPVGDPFYVDYVAHEIGHQFGGSHTFNGSSGSCAGGNRTSTSAYEPGSGSTIQAYAGICSGQNIQNRSDAYFHLRSLNQMTAHVTTGSGNACYTGTNTGNNTPVANANFENINNKSIPISTPFELTGTATDIDGDALKYSWEQWDLGPAGTVNAASTNAPIFRSFLPSDSPTRIFPQLTDIINNVTTYGEVLPAVGRDLNFQFIARDNRVGGGGFHADQITLKVAASAGPFKVAIPNTSGIYSGVTTVIWDVANTDAAPVFCLAVDILLSTDGGLSYPTVLASNTPNDGSQQITFPAITTSTARIKIKSRNNVFFDISDTNFTINTNGGTNCAISAITAFVQTACNSATDTYEQTLQITHTNAPTAGQLVVNNQFFSIGASPQTVTLTNLKADGNKVDGIAYFSNDGGCSKVVNNLFTAPTSCVTLICANSVASTDVPKTISPTGTPTITSTINVPLDKTIQDVNISNLIGTHTWLNDLEFTLTSPAGTTIALIANACFNEDDFNLNLDNTGVGTLNCPYNDGNTYLPAESFTAFEGENTQGTWTLTINDSAGGDGGALQSWSIGFCYFEEVAARSCGDLALNGPVITPDTYTADNIFSAGQVTGTVNFLAGESITLSPGFSATATATFVAKIVACTPSTIQEVPSESVTFATKMTPTNPLTATTLKIYPNPTTGAVQIEYTLPTSTKVLLQLFDANGQLIQTIVPASKQAAGNYQRNVDVSKFTPGIYYTVFSTPEENNTQKLVLMR